MHQLSEQGKALYTELTDSLEIFQSRKCILQEILTLGATFWNIQYRRFEGVRNTQCSAKIVRL